MNICTLSIETHLTQDAVVQLVPGFNSVIRRNQTQPFASYWYHIVVTIGGVYVSIGVTLFACLAFFVYHILNSLKNEVNNISAPVLLETLKVSNWARYETVAKTKRYYGLLSVYLSELESCFGPILLVLCITAFTRTINNTFYALLDLGEKDLGHIATSLLLVSKDLAFFFLSVFIPHLINWEVKR